MTNTVDLSTGSFSNFGGAAKVVTFASAVEVTGNFVPSGQRRWFYGIALASTTFQATFSNSATIERRGDLTTKFEKQGQFRVTIGSTDYVFPLNNQDTSDNYRLTQPADTIASFFAAFNGVGIFTIEFPGEPDGRVLARKGSVEYTKVYKGSVEYTKVYLGSTEY